MSQAPNRRSRHGWDVVEIVAWVIGIIFLAECAARYVEGMTGRREALDQFAILQAAAQNETATTDVTLFAGTGEVALNQGVGHIEDTAAPGTEGNSGIAGHRDGFFRGLKDIEAGDTLELETLHRKERYRVERIWVVNPDDVSVLDPTPQRALTLVTCYPFYFVGPAPRRYIVRAVRDDT
jgi:sortase A